MPRQIRKKRKPVTKQKSNRSHINIDLGVVVKYVRTLLAMIVMAISFYMPAAAAQSSSDDGLQVMQAFNEQAEIQREKFELTENEKHRILFYMGVVLLVLLCATAYLGLSMVMEGKQVFVAHMVCAGLTVTLAFAHAVAAVVWFFPF